MAAVIPPPPTHNNNGSLHPTSRAVDRSVEFLSAARTALRISQQRHQRRRQQSSSSYHNDDGDDGPPLPEWLADLNPADLHLYRHPPPSYGSDGDGDDGDGGFGRYDAPTLVRDSQSLLSLLDSHLSDLHALVRRRGHTNDPTIEIQGLMERFQEGAREVKDVCDSLRLAGTRPPRDCDGGARSSSSSSSQRRKHYEMLSLQLEAQARERTDALKRELETRSRVLRDQSHRRKLLASGGGRGGVGAAGVGGSDAPPLPAGAGMAHRPATRMPAQNGAASLSASSSQFRSPLFTATSGGMVAANANATARRNAPSPSAPSAYPAYAGYGGSSSASASAATAGYGGASTTSAVPPAMGMRQRRQQQGGRYNVQIDSGGGDDCEDKYNKSSEPSSSSSSSSMQQQISQRREQRATHARAQQARIAERSIAELGVMFTKMSTLISQQGEALERIEDDVEAAGMDIDAGHNELVKVYGMTKGNRGLILKVFGILIFLIIFFKLY